MRFENEWLARYPKPARVIFDNGGEFIGGAFQSLLITNGIKPVPTTSKNPQANAVAERMHKTVGDLLRVQLNNDQLNNLQEANLLIDNVLASASYALRSTVHTTLGVSPGALIFQRDMQLNIPVVANYEMIRNRRQARIDYNLERENRRRRFKDYNVGDEVLLIKDRPDKLETKTEGPFTVQQIHVNGTITILRREGVYERVNIRRVKPYNRNEADA
jgi:hypothetical protein